MFIISADKLYSKTQISVLSTYYTKLITIVFFFSISMVSENNVVHME